MALLELSGVTKRFGGLTAVDNVTFNVEAGEIFGRHRVIAAPGHVLQNVS